MAELLVRRSIKQDAARLTTLFASGRDVSLLEARFRGVDFAADIERALLSITVHEAGGELVGFASFYDYPRIMHDVLGATGWEAWLAQVYHDQDKSTNNTAWLSVFVAEESRKYDVATIVFQAAFNAMPRVNSVALALPREVHLFAPLRELFENLLAQDTSSGPESGFTVAVCAREMSVPRLVMRRARVEDNDDLAPIFDEQSDILRATYGEFFLATVIENQNDDVQVLVAESDGTAVGLMSITRTIDLHLLQQCFELEPYGNLERGEPAAESDSDAGEAEGEGEGEDKKDAAAAADEELEKMLDPSHIFEASQNTARTGTPTGSAAPLVSPVPSGNLAPATSTAAASGSGPHPAAVAPSTSSLGHASSAGAPSGKASPLPGAGKVTPAGVSAAAGASTNPTPTPAPVASSNPLAEDTDSEEDGQRPTIEVTTADAAPLDNAPLAAANAFSIHLFCLDNHFKTRAYDFLEAAFAAVPERDYLLLTAPYGVPEVALLEYFTRVRPRPQSTFPHLLYIIHRGALATEAVPLGIRAAVPKDRSHLGRLVAGVDGADLIMRTYDDSMRLESVERLATTPGVRAGDDARDRVVVVELNGQIIGAAVVSSMVDLTYLRHAFAVEEYVSLSYHRTAEHLGLIKFVLNPIFLCHTHYIFQEVMRQLGKTNIYYQLEPTDPTPPYLEFLIPVPPRRALHFSGEHEHLNDVRSPCGLFLFCSKFVFEPKFRVNARVVIVGASDVALSLLEHLSFINYAYFTSLTLVSNEGLSYNANESARRFRPRAPVYTQERLQQLCLDATTRVVKGTLTDINRQDKFINTTAGEIPYEYLILATGMQYHSFLDYDLNGVFCPNTEEDVEALLIHMKSKGATDRVVVFGNTIDAYCVVEGLLESKVPGANIHLVLPPQEAPPFDDSYVQTAVREQMTRAGVRILANTRVVNVEDGGERIVGCILSDGKEESRLGCSTLIIAAERTVDPDAFHAINDACLVFSGRLVVDNHFRTTDPNIFALGSLTKFANKYHTAMRMDQYSSREVGVLLARAIRAEIDPVERPARLDGTSLPRLTAPRITRAVLPGGLEYAATREPGPPNSEGRVTEITTNVDGETYTRLVVDEAGRISAITYLGRARPDLENLLALAQIPVSYLNRLLKRYKDKQLPDIFTFLRESWAMAVEHDRFGDLRQDLREELMQSDAMKAMMAKATRLIESQGHLTDAQREALQQEFMSTSAKHLVEDRAVQFLWQNDDYLPMFHIPARYLQHAHNRQLSIQRAVPGPSKQ